MATYFALIPAAGSGSRMSRDIPKQYVELCGRPLLYYAIRRMSEESRIRQVFVVLAPGDKHFTGYDWSEFDSRVTPLYCGGESRAASVFNGLIAARDEIEAGDWVLVHDAARPCLGASALTRLIDELTGDETGGLLAIPVADTLKRAGSDNRVARTESREGLWQAQTPQMFRYRMLIEALRRADLNIATDEARAVEDLGVKPRLVWGSGSNLKVTQPDDLALAELILTNSGC
jgi:2-C-methyl-D-erythritol 4-phosphate cytidylyltransferase